MPQPRRLHAAWRRRGARRFFATFMKELIQLRRDRITFATMIVIPLIQLLLFGYAINTDPKNLPTAVLVQDDSAFARSFLAGHAGDRLFRDPLSRTSENELDHLLLSGRARSSACTSRRISAAT